MKEYTKLYVAAYELDLSDLEHLCIALMKLRSKDGLLLNLKPHDVFQDWFLEHFPKPLGGNVDVP